MNRKYPLAAFALTAAAWPATASAAGTPWAPLQAATPTASPWTVKNPGGITWTAPNNCTLRLDLTTFDAYPTRITTETQAYELVVAYRNGVEIGRTRDLANGASATEFASLTTPVAAGDVVTVVHSSKAGLLDGTANSVQVSALFDCPPPAPTTTFPETTTTTVPPAPETTVAETVPTTSVVAVDLPPVPAERVAVVEPPRAAPATTVAPAPVVYALPETGPSDTTSLIAHVAAITLGVGALVRLRWGVRR